MLGISNYVFIIIGLFFVGAALFNYKIYNPRIWGRYRKKKGTVGLISGFMYRYDILKDYINIIIGIFMISIGLYGILYSVHDKDDVNFKDISHTIFNKKEEKDK